MACHRPSDFYHLQQNKNHAAPLIFDRANEIIQFVVLFYKYKNHQYNTNCDNSINNSKQYNRINFVCFF